MSTVSHTPGKNGPNIEFVDIEESYAANKPNEYDPIVAALLEAGEGKGYPLTTSTTEHATAFRKFQRAARRFDRTARKVSSTEDGDTTITVVRLRPKVTRKSGDTGVSDDTETDAE